MSLLIKTYTDWKVVKHDAQNVLEIKQKKKKKKKKEVGEAFTSHSALRDQ